MPTSASEITVFLIIATILILAFIVFTVLILFLYQQKQVAFVKSVESLKLDHEKNLLKTQLEIQEQTFQNISRDIHDNIGLSLTLAKLNLNTLDLDDKGKCNELISSSIELISKSINDLSDMSKCLNSDAISQQGLLNALQLEVGRLEKLNRFKVQFVVAGNPVFFDSQKELFLFRIAQEALNNIIKHADAQIIVLEVCFGLTEIRLSIKDNGKGFRYIEDRRRMQENMKAGLMNMHIRSSLIDGRMQIESEAGKGTTIIVTTPFDNVENCN